VATVVVLVQVQHQQLQSQCSNGSLCSLLIARGKQSYAEHACQPACLHALASLDPAAAAAAPGLQLLGRADNVKDYIRRGCDRGWVETTLSGGPGRPDLVIRCELYKTESNGYKTDWRINRECCQQLHTTLDSSLSLKG
jgi:hypothetical protein